MKTKLLAIAGVLALFCAACQRAPEPIRYQAQPTGCEMRLDGDSTVHRWSCISTNIAGFFEVESAWRKDPTLKLATCLGPRKTPPKCEVQVPVRSLKSQVSVGGSAMEKRMQAEMNVTNYPDIGYRLTEMTIKGVAPTSGSPVTFDTKGLLMVRGSTNPVSFPITMERVDGDTLKFTGTLDTTMTACGVKPPEIALLGMGVMKTADPIKLAWTWVVGIKKD